MEYVYVLWCGVCTTEGPDQVLVGLKTGSGIDVDRDRPCMLWCRRNAWLSGSLLRHLAERRKWSHTETYYWFSDLREFEDVMRDTGEAAGLLMPHDSAEGGRTRIVLSGSL